MISRRGKRAAIGFFFLGIFLVIFFFALARFFAGRELERRLEEERASLKPRPLNVFQVKRETRVLTRRYSADVRPWVEAQVAAEVAGRVIAVHVEPGSHVDAGEVMIELDETLARIALKTAEAAVASAQAQLQEAARLRQEAERLAGRKVISQSDLDAASAKFESAQAEASRLDSERARAVENLERHQIRAPFEGTVNARLVEVGAAVNVNQPVARLADLDPLRVVFHVNAQEVDSFRPGERVRLSVAGAAEQAFTPEIAYVTRAADPATRLFRVEAKLPNAGAAVRGNVQGTVEASIAAFPDGLFVPASAVRIVGEKAFIEVEHPEGGFELVEVRIGPEVQGAYPVVAGVNEGDRVIIR